MFSLEKRGMFEDSREQLAARVGGNSKTIKTKSQTQGTKALLLNALFDTCDKKMVGLPPCFHFNNQDDKNAASKRWKRPIYITEPCKDETLRVFGRY